MGLRLFLALVIVWPAAVGALSLALAADLGLYAGDPRRDSKLFIVALMPGTVMAAFGARDWWRLFLPEFEPDFPPRFLGRVSLLYGLAFASTALAYTFVWLVRSDELRFVPAAVAFITLGVARAVTTPVRQDGPTPPDTTHSYDTRIPASVRRAGKPGGSV